MQLVPCARPSGPLERAPRTSLRANSEAEHWDGFWSIVDEAYYARCTRNGGDEEEWFCYVEESARERVETPRVVRRPASTDASRRRVMLLLTKSVGARSVLVGSAHRKAR